ncbi:MAG: hemerythrin domain-containing protein [Polyangiaceae bacterium]|jgi:hypothetical protein|nr:hemerythrin domain-containing protein [Polyangiaceae bacterium]MBK8938766.1 hemerythrin domain-containing protein [Polyangiaceae bacterium]
MADRSDGARARFARQHSELSQLAKDVLRALDTRTLEIDPTPARRALAVFAGRLRVHAAMEQDALYPSLLASGDPSVVAKARELLDEVGDLYEAFFAHQKRWADAAAIRADAETFCRDTMMLFARLRVRMKRENDELYPLADATAKAADADLTSPSGTPARC